MAVLFDSRFAKGQNAGGTSFSFVSNAGTEAGTVGNNSNRILMAIAAFSNGATSVGTVTFSWNGVTFPTVSVQEFDSANRYLVIGVLITDANIATGNQTLQVAWTGAHAQTTYLGAISMYNADQTTGYRNNVTATGVSTSPALTIATANGNMTVTGWYDANASSPFTLGAVGVLDWDERAFNGNTQGAHNAATGSSDAWTATLSISVGWAVVGLDVIAASGASGTTLTGFGRRLQGFIYS